MFFFFFFFPASFAMCSSLPSSRAGVPGRSLRCGQQLAAPDRWTRRAEKLSASQPVRSHRSSPLSVRQPLRGVPSRGRGGARRGGASAGAADWPGAAGSRVLPARGLCSPLTAGAAPTPGLLRAHGQRRTRFPVSALLLHQTAPRGTARSVFLAAPFLPLFLS